MTLFRTPGFLSALRGFVLRGPRPSSRAVRVVTVPAPLARAVAEPRIMDAPRPADLSAARAAAAAAARVTRGSLQTPRNKVLLSRRA